MTSSSGGGPQGPVGMMVAIACVVVVLAIFLQRDDEAHPATPAHVAVHGESSPAEVAAAESPPAESPAEVAASETPAEQVPAVHRIRLKREGDSARKARVLIDGQDEGLLSVDEEGKFSGWAGARLMARAKGLSFRPVEIQLDPGLEASLAQGVQRLLKFQGARATILAPGSVEAEQD